MDNSNITPVYQGLYPQGTNSTSTSLVAYGSGTVEGYGGLYTQGTTSTSTSLASSTYQYLGGGTPLDVVTKQASSSALTYDVLNIVVNYTKSFDEHVLSADFFNDGTRDLTEYVPAGDGLFVSLIKTFDEHVLGGDAFVRGGGLLSNAPVGDGLFTNIVKTFSEGVLGSDSVDAFPFFDVTDSMAIMVEPEFDTNDSAAIQVSGFMDASDTMDIVISPTTLASVIDASSVSNPFLPTIIAGGVTYVTNPCTAPPPSYVPTANTYYVNYLNAAIGSTSYCDMTQSNMTLDTQGGSFFISSQNPLGAGSSYTQNLGQVISAYGFTGTITDFGKSISPSENTYQTSGIFGNPNLNKPFNLITYGSNQYFAFLTNQYGLNYAPPVNSFTTVRGMAQAIASMCGITLSWLVPDAPYHDIFGQSGLTGWEALNALAAQVGANVRWNGSTHYYVAYPDYFQGYWYVPNPLLLAGTFKYSYHLDLGYGVSGSGILGLPTNVYFDPGVKTLPTTQNTVAQENIERIASVTKAFTQQDPTLIVDLDNDIVSVKIQILVPAGQEGGGQYVTDNPSIWFDLGSPSISNPYVKVTKVGDSYRNQLWADYRLFPNLAAINNGNFTMNFGIVRRSLNTQYEAAQQDNELLLRELQARIAANVRFIKTYSGTFSCYFFGSLPLPGMWASATYCGETVQGIVESVTLSGNGILTVEVAQYFRINLLDRKLNWALTTGNYGNI